MIAAVETTDPQGATQIQSMDRPLVFTNQCFKTKENNLSIAEVTEVIASSTKSFDDVLESVIVRIQAP